MKVSEQENIVRELESALEHLTLQTDRRMTQQQKEHEQKMQLILQHFKGMLAVGYKYFRLFHPNFLMCLYRYRYLCAIYGSVACIFFLMYELPFLWAGIAAPTLSPQMRNESAPSL